MVHYSGKKVNNVHRKCFKIFWHFVVIKVLFCIFNIRSNGIFLTRVLLKNSEYDSGPVWHWFMCFSNKLIFPWCCSVQHRFGIQQAILFFVSSVAALFYFEWILFFPLCDAVQEPCSRAASYSHLVLSDWLYLHFYRAFFLLVFVEQACTSAHSLAHFIR